MINSTYLKKGTALCIFVLFLFFVTTSYSQVTGYTFSSATGTYTEITGGVLVAEATGTSGVTGLDDVIYNMPDGTIPFDFYFNGTLYSGFNLSTNGFITFGATPPGTTTYTPISATLGYEGAYSSIGRDLIGRFGFTADRTTGSDTLTNVDSFVGLEVGQLITGTGVPLNTNITALNQGAQIVIISNASTSTGTAATYVVPTGSIRMETLGSAPNRVLVIQWKRFSKFTGPGDEFNFQIRLYETTSVLETVYGSVISNATNASPQVGLRGLANTDFNNRTTTTDWTASTPGATNSASMTLTNIVFPPNGLTFTWTPPNFGPSISYTPLGHTNLFGNRNLDDVLISDPDGIAGGALAPRVYWKVNSGAWQSAATSSGSSPYDFIIGTAGLVVGDTVSYFVVAQDIPGVVTANPSGGFSATDVNNITTYPTNPNSYFIVGDPLSGDYTIGLPTFRALSNKDITFEKRTRTIEIEEFVNENDLNPEQWENNNAAEITLNGNSLGNITAEPLTDIVSKRTVEQVYYVPMLNGEEYKGLLLHEFTPEQIERYNLTVGGVYATITEALTDLNLRGVSGPVRFILEDASYPTETFPLVIEAVSGVSSTNTITILPNVGVTTTITGSLAQPIFDLDGASYVIFEGRQNGVGTTNSLTISNTSTAANTVCIRFINGATNNIVQYVNLIGMPSSSITRVIELSSSISDPGGNSDNLVTNCDINGGRYGIYFNGTAANPNMNNVFMNNRIYDATFTQFYMITAASNTTIENNEIFSVTAQSTANSAINILASASGGVNNIVGNKIYDLQNTSTTTIRGITGSPAAGSTLNIFNNFISMTQDNGTKTSIYAIQLSGTTEYTANVYYNTMRLGGTHTGGTAGTIVSGGLIKSNTGATSTFNAKNNISVNNRTSGTSGVVHTNFFIGSAGLVGTLDIDYNVWWADGGAGAFHSGWNGFVYNNQQTYRDSAAPHEQNTIFKEVHFVSNTDLHVTGTSVGDLDLIGMPIAGITTDIDGDTRHLEFPYRGADEGDIPLPVELLSFAASVDGNAVSLTWSTASEINNNGFEIERKLNAGWENIGFLKGNGTTSSTSYYSFSDKYDFNAFTGTAFYRLKQIDFDGTFAYSNTVEVEVDFTPKEYTLYQNYPNPFNPSTTIKYALPFDSNVKLRVYNLLGEVVSELVNLIQETGFYDINWNAGSLSSGIYFYTISAKSIDGQHDFYTVKKMLMIK